MATSPFCTNFYCGVGLERADHLRADTDWIAGQLRDPRSRFLPLWRSKHLFSAEAAGDVSGTASSIWLDSGSAASLLDQAGTWVFLGLREEVAHIALDLSHLDDPEHEPVLAARGRFRDLREVGPLLEQSEGATLAYARGLLHWHRRHLFCGVCGHATHSRNGGHLRRCGNPDCQASHFPRVDPAVIMLVHDGADRCLLGRQANWPSGMHSTLAGFVEPGESLEEAVAREVMEEVGLDLLEVAYHSSQPWPFPSSLMLGFTARARAAAPKVNLEELEAAAWYSRQALLESPENELFRLPRRDSIARRLIEDWLNDR